MSDRYLVLLSVTSPALGDFTHADLRTVPKQGDSRDRGCAGGRTPTGSGSGRACGHPA